MRQSSAIALFILLSGAPVFAQVQLCNQTAQTIDALEREIIKTSNENPNKIQFWKSYKDKNDQTIWAFTTEGHPAHPAVACNVVGSEHGKTNIKTYIVCSADKNKCDQLSDSYRELHKKIAEYLGNPTVDSETIYRRLN